MSTTSRPQLDGATVLRLASAALEIEAQAILGLRQQMDENFVNAVSLILNCTGRVVVTGMGKSGHIGLKIAATLASTGTPAFFMHPAEASHGDLGMVTQDDVVEALHGVEDPELGMDIVELGLYYEAEIDGPKVKVIHSLTSMGCPAGPMIQESIHDAVAALPGVDEVEVELTFDPPWTPDRMSEDAKFILGFG